MLAMGRKGGPRDTRPVDPMTGHVLTPEKTNGGKLEGVTEGDEADPEEISNS